MVKKLPAMQETRVQSLCWEDALEVLESITAVTTCSKKLAVDEMKE